MVEQTLVNNEPGPVKSLSLTQSNVYKRISKYLFLHSIIWATALIYFDEKKMWRQAGAKWDQNEMGDSKDEIIFDVNHIYEHIDVQNWKTRPIIVMVEKCRNLRNETKGGTP